MIDPTDLQKRLNRIRESSSDLRSAMSSRDVKWQRQIHHVIMLEVSILFDEIQFQVEQDREACQREGHSFVGVKSSLRPQLPESPDAGHAV